MKLRASPLPWCDKKRKIQNKNIEVSYTLKTKQTEIMYNIGEGVYTGYY